jgi:hypothetical protein
MVKDLCPFFVSIGFPWFHMIYMIVLVLLNMFG